MEKKVTTNPKLGQDRESRSIKKETYNSLLIVFIVTRYSLQKNTRFVDRVGKKVTITNPKLGQDRKSRSIKNKKHLKFSFGCVHCNTIFFTERHKFVDRVEKRLQQI